MESAPVTLGRHVIVGCGSVILPGVTMHEGSGMGALSLVRRDCEPFGLYSGMPARRVAWRSDAIRGACEELRAIANDEGVVNRAAVEKLISPIVAAVDPDLRAIVREALRLYAFNEDLYHATTTALRAE